MDTKKTYLALGDSYTIGEGATTNFPTLLSQKMDWQEPTIIAKTGWTSKDLIEAIKVETLAPTYDYISLLIGVNNQYQGKTLKEFRKELDDLIKIGLEKAAFRFFLVGIPNYGYTPFGRANEAYITADLKKFNKLIQEKALENHLQYIDIWDISLKPKTDKTLLAADSLHPSAFMYKLWVDQITEKLAL